MNLFMAKENGVCNSFEGIVSNLFDVVKKLSIVVTPRVTLAGSAFHSIQNVTKLEVTKIMPEQIYFSELFYSNMRVIKTIWNAAEVINKKHLDGEKQQTISLLPK